MNRNDFRVLTRLRLKEAGILLKSGCFEGSYYLSGYAVECALKACYAKKTKRFDFPDLDETRAVHSHDLRKLAEMAGVLTVLTNGSARLAGNWGFATQWKAVSRYSIEQRRVQAEQLYGAISAKSDGVLSCLQKLW